MKKQIVVFLFLFFGSGALHSQQGQNSHEIAADTVINDIAVLSTNLKTHGSTKDLFTVKIIFKNLGIYRTNFTAHGKIYRESKIVSSSSIFLMMDPGETREAEMSFTYTENPGKYQIKIFSNFDSDQNPTNDTLYQEIELHESLPEASWHTETEMPVALSQAGTAFYNKKASGNGAIDTGYIFVLGGLLDGGSAKNTIMKYNTASHAWSYSDTSFPQSLYGINAAQIGGKIYIPGGYGVNGTGKSDNLYIYDIETDSLGEGANMLYSCAEYAIGNYNDSLIYVIGGRGVDHNTNQVQIYNVRTNSWKYGTPFPGDGRGGISGSLNGTNIVFAGGYANDLSLTSKVDVGIINPIDPYMITWKDGGEYPAGKWGYMPASSFSGKNEKYIIFTGGYVDESQVYTTGETWAYDVDNDIWLACPDRIQKCSDMGAATVTRNDSAFIAVVGGWSSDGFKNIAANEWLYVGAYEPALDIMVMSIDMDDTLHIRKEYIPKASFKNMHPQNHTFTVTMEITPGDYKDVDTVSSLAYLSTKQIEFAKWKPLQAGKYTIKAYTFLEGDMNTGNDTITSQVYVRQGYNGAFWQSEPDMPIGLDNTGAAFFNKKAAGKDAIDTGYIFVIGGRNSKANAVNTIMKYNIVSKIWSYSDTTLPLSLSEIQVVQIGGKIYIPGGRLNSGIASGGLYIYDIDADTLGKGADMPHKSRGYAIGSYNDSLIYVIGCKEQDYLNLVQIYNINRNSWNYGTPFPGEGRELLSGSICGNKIILAGGWDGLNISSKVNIGLIDPDDPFSITWRDGGEYPSGKWVFISASPWSDKNGKYIFFLGGFIETDNTYTTRDTWAYDVENEIWLSCPEIIPASGCMGVTTVLKNDSVFIAALGGWSMETSLGTLALNEWLYVGKAAPDSIVAISEEPNAPAVYSLAQNYPNPFNPTTIIKYSIAEAGQVELKIYNMLGQEIKTLVNEMKNAGNHEVKFNAAGMNLSSGVYIYRIKTGSFVQSKKLMLIK